MNLPNIAFGSGFGGKAIISNTVKPMSASGIYATPSMPVISEKKPFKKSKIGQRVSPTKTIKGLSKG